MGSPPSLWCGRLACLVQPQHLGQAGRPHHNYPQTWRRARKSADEPPTMSGLPNELRPVGVWQDSLADGRHRGTGILPVSNSTGWKPVPRACQKNLPHTSTSPVVAAEVKLIMTIYRFAGRLFGRQAVLYSLFPITAEEPLFHGKHPGTLRVHF